MPNRLINEKSPYLLQHAHNPVDWYSWGEEAFEKAKKEDKPIFLSIGYSTCYWCHVMEREVFENEEIAKEMNRIFVNIKVDREERPDVDRVYMTALQTMTGSGGWPMSMFLTNDLKPFYGATYVPPESKYGLPGFEDLIHQLEKAWKTRRDEINKSGENIIKFIKEASVTEKYGGELTDDILLKGSDQFKNTFDDEYGGFGAAPKFPRPPGLNFLLRMFHRFQDGDSLKMLVRTLLQMARGGMYDHIGGGFHRYSVDRFWRVPHFEKMLYDQAQLVAIYLEAFQLTGDLFFADTAKEVLNYVSEKLTDKNGGFYSAEDAESVIDAKDPNEKAEGAFYVWEKKEIDELLGNDAEIFNFYYGVWEAGNAPAGSDPHNVFTNKNILYCAHTLSETSNKFEKSTDEVDIILTRCRKKLYEARENRPHPHLDDKILTSWNGLMVSAYSKAYQVIGESNYLDSAKRSADFIIKNLFDNSTKTLLHRYRDGEARFTGNLEDYALFTQSLIDLYESCFDEKYLDVAENLMATAINNFYDNESGGFYDTSGKDSSILVRTKEDYDSAEPTGNSIAILNLLRLSYILDNKDWYYKAHESLLAFADKITKMPYAMPQMLAALDYFLHKPKQIIIAGRKDDSVTQGMLQEVYKKFLPDKVLIQIDTSVDGGNKTFASKVVSKNVITTAYVCENFACKLPVKSVEEFRKVLMSEVK